MKPKHFVLFPWGMISRTGERAEKLLQSIKECGFNGSCFVTKDEFDVCRKLGLDIYYSMNDNGGQERELRHEVAMADPAVSEQALRDIVYGLLEDLPEDVHSVYVTDERGAGMFPRVKIVADCIAEKAPWAERYINLFPNYAVCGAPNLSQLEVETYEEYLERFAVEVQPDFISIDNYYVNISDNFKDPKGRVSFFSNMVQAREACDKYDIPFQYVVCCNQLRHWQTIPTFANLALQGFASLAAGARAISWFLYFGRGGYLYAAIDDTTGEDIKTPTWYLLREVNRRILPLGELLFDMDYKGLYFSDTTDIPRAKSIADCPAIQGFTADGECVCGHYTDKDGKDAVLVVNANLQYPIKIDVDLGGELEYYNIELGKWMEPLLTNAKGDKGAMWLEQGCGILLRKQ